MPKTPKKSDQVAASKKKKRSDLAFHIQKLRENIAKLERDWEELLSKRREASDAHFLHEMAEDIKKLNEETVEAETIPSLEPTVTVIHHMLTTPWGAPFVSEKTLLEAAIAFSYQDPLQSDLFHLMDDFVSYSSLLNNQFLTVLSSLSKDLS